jgi:hypothetical protein
MTNQNTATSWMRPAGACALVAGILVFMANVSMARSQTAAQALLAGISHPLVLISIPLGLYWLLRPKSRTAPPQAPDDDFPSLEPPPSFPAKSEASCTTSTSSCRRYLGYVVVIGSLVASHAAAVFMGSLFRHPTQNAPLHADAVAAGPTVIERENEEPLQQTLALKPIVEADPVDSPVVAPPVSHNGDLGIVTAVSDHLVWISFQHPVEEWDGRKVAVERAGDAVGVMTVTRVSGGRLVADGAVDSLSTGDVLTCRLQPYVGTEP